MKDAPAGMWWVPWALTAAVVGATVGALRWEGRLWWCACGRRSLWVSDIWSEHCSQHLVDAYAFSHVSHGFFFYGALAWIPGPWRRLSFGWKLCIATAVECAWEVLENSPLVIERYRSETIAIGYIGDSVINAFADILAAALGVFVARALGWKWTLALFVAIEFVMLITIRDNLTLNVLMLLWPVEAIKEWQSVGQTIG